MKKHFSLLIAIIMLLSMGLFVKAEEERGFRIFVDGNEVSFDYSLGYPFAKFERTFVPIRFIANNLGFTTNWDQGTQTATINNDTITLKLGLNKNTAEVNGVTKAIDTTGNIKTEVKDDRIYVPLRFVSENMGARVDYEWTKEAHIIKLTTKNGEIQEEAREDLDNSAVNGMIPNHPVTEGIEKGGSFETNYKHLNFVRAGVAPFDKDGFLHATTNDWPREIQGAKFEKSMLGLLRRVGETPAIINKRSDVINEGALTGPNVSSNWYPIELITMSKDPFLNNGSISHFTFTETSAKYLKDNGQNMTIKIQLIDDRYLPYDKWEIKDKGGKWKTLTGPITDESEHNLAALANTAINSKGEKGINEFYFWGGEGADSPLKGKLRFKGRPLDLIPNINIYDKIRYRATVKQGDEEHVFEFNTRFQWAAGKFHMRRISLDAAATIGPTFGSCYNRNTEDAYCGGWVEDVVQIR